MKPPPNCASKIGKKLCFKNIEKQLLKPTLMTAALPTDGMLSFRSVK